MYCLRSALSTSENVTLGICDIKHIPNAQPHAHLLLNYIILQYYIILIAIYHHPDYRNLLNVTNSKSHKFPSSIW